MLSFGQVVIGPPGSGKTTYCQGMAQYLRNLGREVVVVNLDPANDELPYECGIDIEDLVTLASVMDELKLGPNGGMMFCMEYLEKNMDWLKGKLAAYPGHYFLFDCPGQAELYTHHNAVKGVLAQIDKLGIRLATVHLIDSHHCTDPTKYVSALLLSLQTMLKLELPHVNVLSKIDLVEQYGRLAFDIEYYSEVMDLEYLVQMLDNDVFGKKYHGLNKALCELVEDFNLVGFATLNIEDKESILDLLKVIDKANGYMYGYKDEAKAQYMAPTQEKSDPSLPTDAQIKEHFHDLERAATGDIGDDDDEDDMDVEDQDV